MAANTAHLKFQSQPVKPKRRRCRRETTITTTTTVIDSSSSSSTDIAQNNHCQSRKLDTPIVVSPENSWCCSASRPPSDSAATSLPLSSSSDLKIRNLTPTMEQYNPTATDLAQNGVVSAHDSFASSFSKFNSALTAGLLNPMSPPPDKARSSPTLFEMMANEPDCYPRSATLAQNGAVSAQNQSNSKLTPNPAPQDKRALMQQRLMDLLASRSPGNQFNDADSGDVKLTLSSKDGISVSVSVHRQILVAHSRFFASKLNEKWVKQQRSSGPYIVEIADCDDIEVYIETLRLMYCKDLRKKLMKEDVPDRKSVV